MVICLFALCYNKPMGQHHGHFTHLAVSPRPVSETIVIVVTVNKLGIITSNHTVQAGPDIP